MTLSMVDRDGLAFLVLAHYLLERLGLQLLRLNDVGEEQLTKNEGGHLDLQGV